MFLKIIDADGHEEIVNVDNIACMSPSGNSTIIKFVDGKNMKVAVPLKKMEKSLTNNKVMFAYTASPATV